MGPLRIAHWNCRGLRARKLKLANWLTVEKPFLMLINETRMEECKFKNYCSFAVRSDDAWGSQLLCSTKAAAKLLDHSYAGDPFEFMLVSVTINLVRYTVIGGYWPLR